MFKSVLLLLHSCIFILVSTNPFQGFYSYSVIPYQEDYRHERPILVQPSGFSSYPQQFMNQNQLTPYQNTLNSYDDYLQRIYLQNDQQNQINSAIDQNGFKTRRYASHPTDEFMPNVANNYHGVPAEINLKNKTIDCNKREGKCKTRDNKKCKTKTHYGEKNSNSKCRKRKHLKHDKCYGDKEKCSSRQIKGDHDYQSNTKDVKVCRKNRPRNKPQKSSAPKEIDHLVDIKKQTTNKNSNLRSAHNQKMDKKNINQVENELKCKDREILSPELSKKVKNDQTKSNNYRKVIKKDDSDNNCRQIQEQDDYFNINEDCVYPNNRCTRNDDSIKRYQQQYNIPNDFSNSMAHYMMFNQQLFDSNGNFPTNFDYLYNMQQFLNPNLNESQRRPKNRKKNRKRKQKKSNKKSCDQNKTDFQQADGGKKNVELSQKFVEVAVSEPASTISTITEESQIDKPFKEFSDDFKEEIKESLKHFDDSIENVPNDCYELNHKEGSPIVDDIIDDYYPEFHSDNFYTSKEEYDWNNFRDKHYYSSSDMGELGRERRKYDSTNDIKIYNKEEKDNEKLKKLSEEIHFRTPPALDFPDFKTEMINKDKNVPVAEIYYQPNKITSNRYKNNKMSTYSSVKKVESNEKFNKIVDQNYVETVLGHSKVAKYGVPPNKDEIKSGIINYTDYSDEEDKISKSSDGQTIVVIAKSLPYPM